MLDLVNGLAGLGEKFVSGEIARTQKMEDFVEAEMPSQQDDETHSFTLSVDAEAGPTLLWALGWYKVALKEAKKRLEAEDDNKN